MIRNLVRLTFFLVALVIGQRIVIEPTRCNHVMRTVEFRTREILVGSPASAKFPTARGNIRLLESVRGGCARDFEYYLLLALNKRIAGKHTAAIADLTRALQTADRPEIYFDRGLIYLESGRIEAALPDLQIAVEFVPEYINRLDGELRNRIDAAVRQKKADRAGRS